MIQVLNFHPQLNVFADPLFVGVDMVTHFNSSGILATLYCNSQHSKWFVDWFKGNALPAGTYLCFNQI